MTSNTQTKSTNNARRWTIAGLAAATIAAIGTAAAWNPAHSHERGGWGRGMHGPMDPEAMGKRIDGMVQWMLADVNASDEQRTRIAGIAKAAATELAPLRQRHAEARRQSIKLLTAPTIDRAQIEQLRVEQMQLGDTVTRRMSQALIDAAEVLTQEQRAQLATKWENRRQRRHG